MISHNHIIHSVMAVIVFIILLSRVGSMAADHNAGDPIDMNKAKELMQKQKSGQQLSQEDQAYLDRARKERRKGPNQGTQADNRKPKNADRRQGSGRGDAGGATKTSTGIKPLTELAATEEYKGEYGGLYGGGVNTPPEALQTAASNELAKIQPLDKDGNPSPDGKIVLLSIGMSNTTQEFSPFKQAADADPRKSPQVLLVDGAQGGQGAAEWTGANSDSRVWQTMDKRLTAAGVTHKQVQCLWIKQAEKKPLPDSMENARLLLKDLVTILNRAKARFPNLRIAYLSSRTYGGYSAAHPEPESFETALSVRWVIQYQMEGKADLNWDPARGEVKAPLVLWGPYLWADGINPRKSDGLIWERTDFVTDGTHPSDSGKAKVVKMLMDFFTTDPNAKDWFLKTITAVSRHCN